MKDVVGMFHKQCGLNVMIYGLFKTAEGKIKAMRYVTYMLGVLTLVMFRWIATTLPSISRTKDAKSLRTGKCTPKTGIWA